MAFERHGLFIEEDDDYSICRHKVVPEYEHVDHHEMVCLIVMISNSLLLFIYLFRRVEC
jgi:hypothetical protein